MVRGWEYGFVPNCSEKPLERSLPTVSLEINQPKQEAEKQRLRRQVLMAGRTGQLSMGPLPGQVRNAAQATALPGRGY